MTRSDLNFGTITMVWFLSVGWKGSSSKVSEDSWQAVMIKRVMLKITKREKLEVRACGDKSNWVNHQGRYLY